MFKILIVDDEKMIRMGIQKTIKWDSLEIDEVYTAASAKEALEVLETYHPDVMITDISMTEMSGLDLVEQIRKTETDLRIIVLTGYDRFDYARQALKLRVHDFLLKPIDEKQLTECIRLQIGEIKRIQSLREISTTANRVQGFQQQVILEECMREFIHGRQLSEVKTREFYDTFHFNAEQKMKVGILLPDMQVQENPEDNDFRRYTVRNICIGMLDEQHTGITCSDDKGRILLVLFTEEILNDASETAEQIVDVLGDECNVKPRLILGNTIEGFTNLHISYNDAIFSLENEREAFREIVRPSAERRREDIFLDVFREFKRSMSTNVSDVNKVLHIFERFHRAVESYNLSATDTRRCCFELASSLFFNFTSEVGNTSQESLNTFSQSLAGVDRDRACEVTAMFIHKILGREEGDDHEIIRKVKARIYDNLADDLTVSNLASELYVTPNYLSRLFKQVTGEGCNEFIVKKRIEKAKSLLETTSIKAGEIAMLVGYHDINYFSLAFKKHVGMSPTKYRDAVQNKN